MTAQEKINAISKLINEDTLDSVKKQRILPCPFCGEKEINVYSKTLIQPFQNRIECRFSIYCYSCGVDLGDYYKTLDEAVARWNTRGGI